MDIKEIIENEFGLIVHDIFVLGQGLDSIAYLVNINKKYGLIELAIACEQIYEKDKSICAT